jgi:hypothetical protein
VMTIRNKKKCMSRFTVLRWISSSFVFPLSHLHTPTGTVPTTVPVVLTLTP